ncbi:hypothetical protein D3C71_692680 [compost metagenome]
MKEVVMKFCVDLKVALLGLMLCHLSVYVSYGQTPTKMSTKQADSLSRAFTAKAAVYVDHTGERLLSGRL